MNEKKGSGMTSASNDFDETVNLWKSFLMRAHTLPEDLKYIAPEIWHVKKMLLLWHEENISMIKQEVEWQQLFVCSFEENLSEV